MFKNPGVKLKACATLFFVVSLFGAFILIRASFESRERTVLFVLALVLCLAGFVGGLLMYGFAEMMVNLKSVEQNVSQIQKSLSENTTPQKEEIE